MSYNTVTLIINNSLMSSPIKAFRYTTSHSGKHYQARASKSLDLSRLVRGLTHWIAPSSSKQIKNKTLILADWTAYNWTYEKIMQILAALSRLMTPEENGTGEPFAIYLWQKGELLKLTQDNLFCLADKAVQLAMRPECIEAIAKKAQSELKLAHDQVQVLDDYWVNCLLSEDEKLPPRTISLADFSSIRFNKIYEVEEPRAAFWQLMNEAKPVVTQIVMDSFTTADERSLMLLKKNLSGCAVVKGEFRKAQLFGEQVETLLRFGCAEHPPHLELDIADLAHLSALELIAGDRDTEILSWAKLQGILLATKKLNTLLIDINTSEELFTLADNSLPELSELTLLKPISAAHLSPLLRAAPKLKKIKLSGLSDGLTLPTGCLAGVQILDLSGVEYSLDVLHHLVSLGTHLQEINLSGSRNLNSALDRLTTALTFLVRLDLSKSTLSLDNLQQIVSRTPFLKSLDLRWCKGLTGALTLPYSSLINLEELYLSGSDVSLELLFALLTAAPNLKKIHLESCQFLVGDMTLIAGALKKLEVFNCSESTLSSHSLQSILHAAPNIKTLNVAECSNLDKTITLAAGSLPKLEYIDTYGTPVPVKSMVLFLSAAPQLKAMICPGFDHCIERPELAEGSLMRLEQFDLSYRRLSTDFLMALFLAAPNLKSLNLSNTRLKNKFTLAPGSLPHLQEIDLSCCQMSLDNLSILLKAALNLRKIIFFKFNPHGGRLNLEPNSLVHLSLLSISDEQILADSTIKLRLAAPQTQLKIHPGSPPASLTAVGKAAPSVSSSTVCNRVSADTGYDKESHFDVPQLFRPLGHRAEVQVSDYRLQVMAHAALNPLPCLPKDAFIMHNEADLKLIPISVKLSEDAGDVGDGVEGLLYYARQTLHLTKAWQALPSLSAQEVLHRYHLKPACDVEIQYSLSENRYYIRSYVEDKLTAVIDFTLSCPSPTAFLPDEIHALVDQFRAFGVGATDCDATTRYTGADYFNAMLCQRKGSCVQRAVLFKLYMHRCYPDLPVRIITNACHSFVEVYSAGVWQACDLGGYPAQLRVQPLSLPDEAAGSVVAHRLYPEPRTEAAAGAGAPAAPVVAIDALVRAQFAAVPHMPLSVTDFCQQCIGSGKAKKRLIESQSTMEVRALSIALQHYCIKTHRPVFFVRSADDLCCSGSYLDASGFLRPGPGGPLYSFLSAHPDGVLVINYEQFTAEELVRFNTMLDKERLVDGVKIPESLQVIGLINVHKEQCYQGADFYSRFDITVSSLLTETQWSAALPAMPIKVTTSERGEDSVDIELFSDSNWLEVLLGQWIFAPSEDERGCVLTAQEGLLQKAIAAGKKRIILHNAPWDSDDFISFWQSAVRLGQIDYQGRRLILPEGFCFERCDGYDWERLRGYLAPAIGEIPNLILNPSTLASFFNPFIIDDKHQFIALKSPIIKASGTALRVYLTRSIDEDAWAKLLTECALQHVTLQLHCAPGVSLPSVLGIPDAPLSTAGAGAGGTSDDWRGYQRMHTAVIQSSDADTTAELIIRNDADKEWLTFDVTDLHDTDLLEKINAQFNTRTLHFEFKKTACILVKLLEANKNVLLKGSFSPELADELAAFVTQRQRQEHALGSLLLVNQENTLAYAHPMHHAVRFEEKSVCLKACDQVRDALREHWQEPLPVLQCRADFLTTNPITTAADTQTAWAGLYRAPESTATVSPFNPASSVEDARRFMHGRIDAVNEHLSHHPYVLLTGLSGAGKTTFVEKNLCTSGDELFHGEGALSAWAKHRSEGGRSLLLIDEATLSANSWRIFEGLYASPPALLIEGEYYPLTAQHRVIFAGNPASYSDRKVASFFARHGNSIWFDALPPAVLYEDILKPTFAGTVLAAHTEAISTHLLAVYNALSEYATTDVLISPRELQMMALLILSQYLSQIPLNEANIPLITAHTAYDLAYPLVPAVHKAAFAIKFKPTCPLSTSAPVLGVEGYTLTPSRYSVYQHIVNTLNLRHLRQQEGVSDALRYGGLGGLILEGEPGIGKSDLVIAALISQGFKEQTNPEAPPVHEDHFYRLPVSWSTEEKIQLLLKAFDEGAVVIIDEINSAPMMEALLNELLMSRYQGKPPRKPGFMVIGTQNPTTMAGRRMPSTALSRRLTTLELSPYTFDEMNAILIHKGLAPEHAHTIISEYQQQSLRAQKAQQPIPTFREVLKVAHHISRAVAGMDLDKRAAGGEAVLTRTRNTLFFRPEPPSAGADDFATASPEP